ncbi:hypothetical protein KIN20_031284 [Parelaphostrongylus tenuis]|uniref:Uncharacterized protein n=1 Tax=Parelaphostrongylus tenuis TaxID=148309 RepID=A0AAD5R5A0_PARTN|nr:hypothetical protein KIN20_031284 [Parelaphostrongylus tenuis]
MITQHSPSSEVLPQMWSTAKISTFQGARSSKMFPKLSIILKFSPNRVIASFTAADLYAAGYD